MGNQIPQRKKTILVVDDAYENIAVIKAILINDYTIKGALSGEIALTVARSSPPDLILLDVIMPEMNGYEVLRKLKAMEETRDIPVIFVTSKDQTEDEIFGIELGAVDYIAKPIKPPLLRARIRTQIMLADALRQVTLQNMDLRSAARLREDVDHILQHDLKSPLTAIIGVPQFLLQHSLSLTKEERDFIDIIKDSGYRMLNMINRSLDLFKMEYGTYETALIHVDLVGCVRGVLSELRTAVISKRLTINITVDNLLSTDTDDIIVMGEELLCHSLFSNLCKNAIESSPNDSDININFTRGPEIIISIENAGEVPDIIRDHFFDKFVTSGKSGGTGIGTYSAILIARTLKGSIALDTSVAGRTCIQVALASYNKCFE